MNKDGKIELLELKLAKVQEEIKRLKLDVREAKREKSKTSKKRRQDRNADQRTTTVTFDAIRRYTYSGFLIKAAICFVYILKSAI